MEITNHTILHGGSCMKQSILCFFLAVLLLLCTACQTDAVPDSSTPTSETAAAVMDTDIPTSETTADSSELTAVRYTLDYEITDIFAEHPEYKIKSPTFYTKNGQLYISGRTYQDGDSRYRLIVLDEYGNPSEYEFPPFEEMGILLRYVYPLENGKYVLVYSPDREDKNQERYLTIANADGTFDKSVYLCSFDSINSVSVYEEPTVYGGTVVYIIADKADANKYYYDIYLEETVVDSFIYSLKKYIGNDSFSYGSFPSNFFRINLKTLETKQYALHLPSDWDMTNIYIGADNQYYLHNDNGIYLYRDDNQPLKILDSQDSGLLPRNIGNRFFIIINSQAVYEYNFETGHLLLYRMERVIDTDTRQNIRIDVLGVISSGLQWLSEGITRFNNQNDTYKISLNVIGDKGGVILQDYWRETLEDMLLFGSHPDMLIIGDPHILESYYDKNIFLDLTDRINTRLLGCVRSVSGIGDSIYQIPLNMRLTTLAAPADSMPQTLTYETFQSMMDRLQEGQYLSAGFNNTFFDFYAEFIDYDTKTAHFNSEEFRTAVLSLYELQNNKDQYTNLHAGALYRNEHWISTGVSDDLADYERYGSDNNYWTINGTVGTALENGDLKFLSVDFWDIRAFPSLKMLFGDTDFTLCGYPSLSGGSAYIGSSVSAAIMWDTEYADVCTEFLNFLLSDSMQTKLAAASYTLPVTYSAMSAEIDRHRYSRYDKDTADIIRQRKTPGYISLMPEEYSDVWLTNFDNLTEEEQKYRIIEITDEDKQMLLDFFENLRPRKQTVSIVKSIIDEEISYWVNNARTLEETTKIIDSRVWIYLNE